MIESTYQRAHQARRMVRRFTSLKPAFSCFISALTSVVFLVCLDEDIYASENTPSVSVERSPSIPKSGHSGSGHASSTAERAQGLAGEGEARPTEFSPLSGESRLVFGQLPRRQEGGTPEYLRLSCASESCGVSSLEEAKTLAVAMARMRWGDSSPHAFAVLPVLDGAGNVFSVLVLVSTDPQDTTLEEVVALMSTKATELPTTKERAEFAGKRFRTIYISITMDRPPSELAWKGLPLWLINFNEVAGAAAQTGFGGELQATAEVARATESEHTSVLLGIRDSTELFLWNPYERKTLQHHRQWNFAPPDLPETGNARAEKIRKSWRTLRESARE